MKNYNHKCIQIILYFYPYIQLRTIRISLETFTRTIRCTIRKYNRNQLIDYRTLINNNCLLRQ